MIHKHEPVTEEAMNWISPKRTICQLIREIYHKSSDPEVRLLCREATAMAKAMTAKLIEDKGEDFLKTFWDENPDFALWVVRGRK